VESLLKIPMGRAVCYSDIATRINSPKASVPLVLRSEKNPISFVCRATARSEKARADRYHWGIPASRRWIGWEAGQSDH